MKMNWNYKALQSQTDSELLFTTNILNDLIQNKHNIRILDMGCSDGYNTIKVFGQFNNVKIIGIDISQDAIQKAQDKSCKSNIMFECVNVEDFNELNDFSERYGKFDMIYCSHLIQHIKDPIEFVKRIHYLLLKTDGYIVIKTIDDSTKYANQQNELLQYILQYYQKNVAPFQELRRCTNRFIGCDMANILQTYYYNISCYKYQQTTEGLSKEDRLQLYNKCFHFRELNDCMRSEILQDKIYLDSLVKLKELFIKEDYIFCTETLLFIAQNKIEQNKIDRSEST